MSDKSNAFDGAYDLVIIGGGPGGYVGAIRAAQLGLKVACVEMRGTLGGTCLNVGCIPSKALLESSHHYEEASHGLAEHGLKIGKVGFDVRTMMSRKEKIVGELTGGIEFLFKKNKVDYIRGRGTILDTDTVEVTADDGSKQQIMTDTIAIATGSDVASLPGIEIDEKKIVSSTGALSLPKVPKKMVVIGGGFIGLELGSVWRRLGADVTVVEFLDRIVPNMDGDISKTLQRILKKQGLTFRMSTKVTAAKKTRSGVSLTVEPAKGGESETIDADVVLVAVGRRPYTEGLGLENVGITPDARGFLVVDKHYRTSVPNIFAIGDVIGGAMLAHKAEEEGIALAEYLAGQRPHMNYDVIPGIVYTHPEAASVGKTTEQLREEGIDFRAGKIPFSSNARAKTVGETEGFVKVLADAKTDRILGVHILGPEAGTIIHEAAVAMEFEATTEDLFRTCHGHPTLNEVVKEAAMAVHKRSISA